MTSVVVLQARTNSSRLPGKVLLPMAGLPLVVLAAMRAANTGREVIVATSNELTDDSLAEILTSHKLNIYRGSLENTLQRVTDALTGYSDSTRVFRLTADNVFPDGRLLDEMESDFVSKKLKYLRCNGADSGLPYGVSAELMYLSDLREAAKIAVDHFDQEHVTPIIRRKYGDSCFDRYQSLCKSHFRATIDSFDDYTAVQHVFRGVCDPISEPLGSLVDRLGNAPFQPYCVHPAAKIILGTAQFGLHYGISNTTGKPSVVTATGLIKHAVTNGVSRLDTARDYGDSEYVIGSALSQGWQGRAQVITKLASLDQFSPGASSKTIAAAVEASVYHSCSALRVHKLDVLLLHRAEYLQAWNGAVWQHLQRLKELDVIGSLGVSVQTPEELGTCLKDSSINCIQMPFNLLDWRWAEFIPVIQELKETRELAIHTRSALLQGLLTTRERSLWWRAGVSEPDEVLNWLDTAKIRTGARTNSDLCIGYCLAQDWIDGVVIGVDTREQLDENLHVLDNSYLDKVTLTSLIHDRPHLQIDALNPATWKNKGSSN